jgi:hypothetical protein
MIENPMVSGLAAHQERDEAHASEETARYAHLHQQMLDALLNDPRREVDCPKFLRKSSPAYHAAWVAVDDEHTEELFTLLSDATKYQSNRITNLLNAIAHAHADLHAGGDE